MLKQTLPLVREGFPYYSNGADSEVEIFLLIFVGRDWVPGADSNQLSSFHENADDCVAHLHFGSKDDFTIVKIIPALLV